MNAINSILEHPEFKDLRTAINRAADEPRQYNKTSAYKYAPDQARFKLVIWFKDQNRRHFYSYDNRHQDKNVIIDEFEALKKLLRLVNKYQGTYKNAIIYANLTPEKQTGSNFNTEVVKFDIYANMKTNKLVNFLNVGKNVILDFKRLEVYGSQKI